MKKGTALTIDIDNIVFPHRGRATVEERLFELDGFFPGERVAGEYAGTKKRMGRLWNPQVIRYRSDYVKPACEHYGLCGGCISQHLPLCTQRGFKRQVVDQLFRNAGLEIPNELVIRGLSQKYYYRNKMEFNFGNAIKAGPLSLGMYQRNHGFNVINTDNCQLISRDMNAIRDYTHRYFLERGIPHYHWMSRSGVLRHLVVRHTRFGQELMVILVTTTQQSLDLSEWLAGLLQLDLRDPIVSVWHVHNDSLANIVQADRMELLHGKPSITEHILDLSFEISPLSFFQTNSAAAEFLYQRVLELVEPVDLALDLYCGTGTITQLLAKRCKHVIGVELIEEAIEAARESARDNKIANVEFKVGDVKDIVAELPQAVDLVVVDPPRAGLQSKVVRRLMEIAPPKIIYVSCNPKTLAQDIAQMEGYRIEHMELIDLFPNTPHVETIITMSRQD